VSQVLKPQPRPIPVPPALDKALAKNPEAKAAFAKLPRSHRKEYATWIADAKQAATVQRRLEKLVPMLLTKRARNAPAIKH
jgi:uncharacterized protein YdeI (YjbR/CyaY-like superfamily)